MGAAGMARSKEGGHGSAGMAAGDAHHFRLFGASKVRGDLMCVGACCVCSCLRCCALLLPDV